MTRLVWQAGMAVGLSEFCEPAGIPTFGYEATTAGIAGTHEPTWPLTAGTTVTDGTIVWTARAATTITWTARPIYQTGSTEPTWPTTVGGTVADNGITWTTLTPAITDAKCPQSKVAFAIEHKVYSPDADVTRYCSTDNPRDWSTQDDAGFMPTGLNSPSSPYVTAMGEYRGRLAVWTAAGLQIWTPDPDPANITLFDTIDGIGTSYSRSHASVAGDLYFLSHAGVRSLSIAAGANTLESGDVGAPIDSIVKAMAAAGDDAIGTYYPGFGQYWLTFTPARPKLAATFPDTCDDATYSRAIALTGGTGTYTSAAFVGGTAPAGATLTISGATLTLAFTHATAGTYTFYVSATDSAGIASLPLKCVVVVHHFQVTGVLPAGVVGVAYSQSVALTDGVSPYGTPALTSGALPSGGTMTVVGATLVFAWPNTVTANTYTFAGTIADATGCVAAFSYSVVVAVDVRPLYTRLLTESHTYRGSYTALASGTPASTPPIYNEWLPQYAVSGIYAAVTSSGTTWGAYKANGTTYAFDAMTIGAGETATGTYVKSVAVSKDAAYIVSCVATYVSGSSTSMNYYVYTRSGSTYNLTAGPINFTLPFNYSAVGNLAFSPDGTKLAHCIIQNKVYVHTFSAGTLTLGTAKTIDTSYVAWRPDSAYIAGITPAATPSNGAVTVFSATSPFTTTGSTASGGSGNRHGLAWSADGLHLYCSADYNTGAYGIKHLSFSTSTGLAAVASYASELQSTLDVTDSGLYLAACNYDSAGLLRTYSVAGDGSLTLLQTLTSFGRAAWWVNEDLVA